MSDREEKTGKNDNGKKNKGGKRNKIVAIEMIILVLLIMAAVAIFIQRDKSVKEAAKIHNQKAKKTEQTPQAAQKENEIEEETGDRDASVPDRSNFAVQPGVSVGTTEQSDEKIVYLTLDDGPSDNTQAVLDILDKYNAKATFFVTGEMPEYKEAVVMADDSGLEIDYLNKEPGIYSARYAGTDTSYDIKNSLLLSRMKGVPDKQRTARFVCAVAAVFPNGDKEVVRGTMEGCIGYEIAGANGFGYDPIFFLPEYGCTSAELAPEKKNELSHRGEALRMMRQIMEKKL